MIFKESKNTLHTDTESVMCLYTADVTFSAIIFHSILISQIQNDKSYFN